jgi:hypothetical protein
VSALIVMRANHASGYVSISNKIVRPRGAMSMQALGLLAHLLSHRDGREVSTELLVAEFSNGVQAVRAAIRELEDHGHLVRERRNTARGFVHKWTVHEVPVGVAPSSDTPSCGNPSDGLPSDGNPDDIKKTSPSEDQLEKTSSFPGDAAGAADAEAFNDKPNASHLVDRWCQAWSAARGGAKPDPVAVKRVAGICKQLAASRTDQDSWMAAWDAAAKAGRQGLWDVIGVLADYRPSARGRNGIDWDAALQRADARDTVRAAGPDGWAKFLANDPVVDDAPGRHVAGKVINGEVAW